MFSFFVAVKNIDPGNYCLLKGSDPFSTLNDPNASGGGPKAYGTYVYEYAAGGNRLNRILFNGQAQETFTYNNSGRITQRAHATAGTTTYAYDDRGLLTQVTKPGLTVSYTYDALGVRKSKTVNGATTRYLTAPLFGLPRILAELDTGNNVQATYVYGGPGRSRKSRPPRTAAGTCTCCTTASSAASPTRST